MNCRDLRNSADSFLAGELPAETKCDVLDHLQDCLTCRQDLAARLSLRGRIRKAFRNSPDLSPAPEFSTQLRTRLYASWRNDTRDDLL